VHTITIPFGAQAVQFTRAHGYVGDQSRSHIRPSCSSPQRPIALNLEGAIISRDTLFYNVFPTLGLRVDLMALMCLEGRSRNPQVRFLQSVSNTIAAMIPWRRFARRA
jgi:hypothetical protein